MKFVRDTEDFSSTLRKMCEFARSVCSDVNSGSSVDDWEHNTWNTLLDKLAEYRTAPVLSEISERRRDVTYGNHESLRFGRDYVRHG